jgi:hypothetical protein
MYRQLYKKKKKEEEEEAEFCSFSM